MEPTEERPIDRLIEYMVSGAQEIAAQEIDLEAAMDDDSDDAADAEEDVDDVWEGWR